MNSWKCVETDCVSVVHYDCDKQKLLENLGDPTLFQNLQIICPKTGAFSHTTYRYVCLRRAFLPRNNCSNAFARLGKPGSNSLCKMLCYHCIRHFLMLSQRTIVVDQNSKSYPKYSYSFPSLVFHTISKSPSHCYEILRNNEIPREQVKVLFMVCLNSYLGYAQIWSLSRVCKMWVNMNIIAREEPQRGG